MKRKMSKGQRRSFHAAIFLTTFSLLSITASHAADPPGTKGPIGTTGKTTTGVTGPVKGTTTTKLKSDIIVINAPVKKVSGPAGSTGSQGPQGIQGLTGPEGEEGMVGPQGPEGLQGIQGIQGIQGPVGPQGIQGVAGVAGRDGAQGPAGPPGPKGDKGDSCTLNCGSGGSGSQGERGIPGIAATISIGSVSLSTDGTFSITNSGNENAAKFDFKLPAAGATYTNTVSADPTKTSCDSRTGKVIAIGVVSSQIVVTCDEDRSSAGTDLTSLVNAGLTRRNLTINGNPTKGAISYDSAAGEWALSIPTGVIGPVKLVTTTDCTSSKKVVGLNLSDSGVLGVDCGEDLTNGSSNSIETSLSTKSSDFSSSQECSSGDVVKGMKYADGKLSFLCDSVGSSYGNDEDSSNNSGGNLSSNSVSSTKCSGATGFAYGLTYTNSKLTIACTGTIPSFSDTAIVNGVSGGSLEYDGTNFLVTIPAGLLGSTVRLDSDNDECSGTDKVSGLTLVSNILKVVCDSDETSPISTVTASSLSAGSNPTVSWSSSSKRLTFGIPAGAKGETGERGPIGASGNDGVTPVISVTSSISSGSPGVSVSTTSANNYKFTFTLPTIPSGYDEKFVCFKNNGEIYVLKDSGSGSSCSSGTRYKMLLDTP
jgi:hypothetical protein